MLNFAVIGRNFVVENFLESASLFDELSLSAVCSRREDTAREFAERHGAQRAYGDISELCDDGDIDFVYVASPNLCHEAQVTALLNAGKHVLCEKPASPTLDGFKRMLAAAQKNDRVLMEAMIPAHLPSIAALRKCMAQVGKIRRARLEYCQYSSRYDKFKNGIVENAFRPELCNGSMMDIGIYCVHMAVMLFGEPQSVTGESVFLPQSIDGEGTLLLNYGDMIVETVYSKITDGNLPSEIQGEDGCVLIDSVPHPHTFTVQKRKGNTHTVDATCDKPDMYYEISDFIKQISGEKTEIFNNYTRAALKVTDTARRITGVNFK